MAVATAKTFQVAWAGACLADLHLRQWNDDHRAAVYVVGSSPQLGGRMVSGQRLQIDGQELSGWKCIKRKEANFPSTADLWQPGANSVFTTLVTGVAGEASGSFWAPTPVAQPLDRPPSGAASCGSGTVPECSPEVLDFRAWMG